MSLLGKYNPEPGSIGDDDALLPRLEGSPIKECGLLVLLVTGDTLGHWLLDPKLLLYFGMEDALLVDEEITASGSGVGFTLFAYELADEVDPFDGLRGALNAASELLDGIL
jgi:hypothetical protein